MTWLFVRNEWTIQNEWMQRNGFCGQIIWQMSIDLSQHANIICLIAYIPPHSFRFYREIFMHPNAKTKSKPGFFIRNFPNASTSHRMKQIKCSDYVRQIAIKLVLAKTLTLEELDANFDRFQFINQAKTL